MPGSSNAAADAGVAGEPETDHDAEFDNCFAVCNPIWRGTALDPGLATKGLECFKVRQIWVAESVSGEDSAGQGNTPTLPGYTRDELIGFQTSDSTLKGFRAFLDRGLKRGQPCQVR